MPYDRSPDSDPFFMKRLAAIAVAAFIAAVLIGAFLGTYARSEVGSGMRAVEAVTVVPDWEAGR
jgi:hypothetical protein